jgi:hypothetical protein
MSCEAIPYFITFSGKTIPIDYGAARATRPFDQGHSAQIAAAQSVRITAHARFF